MGLTNISPAQVLHPVAKPVTFLEFYDAVRAAAPPRFPAALRVYQQPRRVAIAVSGGVDSMALAFLFDRLREMSPLLRVVDNPLSKITAFIINHGLRPGSAEEALAVSKELRSSFKHIQTHVDMINWKKYGVRGDPSTASNLESIARRARYQKLGGMAKSINVESLFLAHHADDQYETVLMRLLAGHGSRGLRGMMPRCPIPECYGMHGVHESGHVDDQEREIPNINFQPPKRAWKYVKRELSSEMDWDLYADELRKGLEMGWHESPYIDNEEDYFRHNWHFGTGDSLSAEASASASAKAKAKARAAAAAAAMRTMARVETEDAGVMVYRPLLEFSKDRLIATCEANKVRWFEDPTNTDPTLTMRNAVRHMVRNHALPAALRKDNVLRLSARCDAMARAQEEEAERWIRRDMDAVFEPNVGTLLVELPSMALPSPPPPKSRRFTYDKKRRELRLAYRRAIAAHIVRRIVDVVSPDKNRPQLSSLQNVVSRLFPALSDDAAASSPPRKPFNHASVYFIPVGGDTHSSSSSSSSRRWYLVREPYPSLQPLPEINYRIMPSTIDQPHPLTSEAASESKPGSTAGERGAETGPAEASTATTDGKNTDVSSGPSSSSSNNNNNNKASRTSVGHFQHLNRRPLPDVWHQNSKTRARQRFELWDGRYWVRVRGRVKAVFRIAPFSPLHAKAFRESLAGGADGDEHNEHDKHNYDYDHFVNPTLNSKSNSNSVTNTQTQTQQKKKKKKSSDTATLRLELTLKRLAPGKVRYTLPALYAVSRDPDTGEDVLRMLALPTLGIAVRGLERWVHIDVRHRKVDWDLFDRDRDRVFVGRSAMGWKWAGMTRERRRWRRRKGWVIGAASSSNSKVRRRQQRRRVPRLLSPLTGRYGRGMRERIARRRRGDGGGRRRQGQEKGSEVYEETKDAA